MLPIASAALRRLALPPSTGLAPLSRRAGAHAADAGAAQTVAPVCSDRVRLAPRCTAVRLPAACTKRGPQCSEQAHRAAARWEETPLLFPSQIGHEHGGGGLSNFALGTVRGRGEGAKIWPNFSVSIIETSS